LVTKDHTARLQRSRVHEFHPHLVRTGFEQRAAGAQDNGSEREAVFIDQPALHECRAETGAAENEQIFAAAASAWRPPARHFLATAASWPSRPSRAFSKRRSWGWRS